MEEKGFTPHITTCRRMLTMEVASVASQTEGWLVQGHTIFLAGQKDNQTGLPVTESITENKTGQ